MPILDARDTEDGRSGDTFLKNPMGSIVTTIALMICISMSCFVDAAHVCQM